MHVFFCKKKPSQGFGGKPVQCSDAKNCAEFWCKNLNKDLVQKIAQGIDAKTFAGFWYKNLIRVLVEKSVQCFGVKTCPACCKNLCSVSV